MADYQINVGPSIIRIGFLGFLLITITIVDYAPNPILIMKVFTCICCLEAFMLFGGVTLRRRRLVSDSSEYAIVRCPKPDSQRFVMKVTRGCESLYLP